MKLSSGVAALLFIIIISGCQTKPSQNPKDYSDSLAVLPNATSVFYAKVNQTDQVTYNLKIDYPATQVTDQLLKALSDKGWVPLKEDYLNPGIPTSYVRGWSSYEDVSKQPASSVHSWQTDWQNKNGDILIYALKYRNPLNTPPDRSSLSVVAVYVAADTAQAMKKASLEILQKAKNANGK